MKGTMQVHIHSRCLNRTYYPKMADAAAVNKPWYMIDAKGQTLGRLASLVAQVLR